MCQRDKTGQAALLNVARPEFVVGESFGEDKWTDMFFRAMRVY